MNKPLWMMSKREAAEELFLLIDSKIPGQAFKVGSSQRFWKLRKKLKLDESPKKI